MDVSSELSSIKGIGEKTKQNFNLFGIFNVMDLLLHFPRSYENISKPKQISEAVDNEKILIHVQVIDICRDVRTQNNKVITTIVFSDGETEFKAKWFNQPYMKNKFEIDKEITLLGMVKLYRNEKILSNPVEVIKESISSKKINSIYPLRSGITNGIISKSINTILETTIIAENLPKWLIDKYKLCSLNDAIKDIHNPTSSAGLIAAKRRLKFQELFTYSLKVLMLKDYINKDNNGISFFIAKEMQELKENLPFLLTGAQSRVVREILLDQKKKVSMNRLVQGDVGSGKTMVAIISMFNVVKNGYQAALMAPTEILAFQHLEEVTKVLKNFDLRIAILSGSLTAKEKKLVKERLKLGEIDILIGTHAMLEDNVEFSNLGMVVTDEQHRFGVMQRSKLFNKGNNVDILVMTATPIPRTLALYLYGDLEVSIIDELPPGRQKIDTSYINKNQKSKAYLFALEEIRKGHQVYIVCPLVEESEELSITSVEENYKVLKEEYFKDYTVEILHGKMPPKVKNDIMNRFKAEEIKVLISTTVIEVGVNVPNASLMIIENAERFGLAQLHQLRGRVGRGSSKSYCILLADIKSTVTKKRMEIMQKSNDGFYISEEDLKIRGSGEIFGYRQSGEDGFILSDIVQDVNILKIANQEAKALLKSNLQEDIRVKDEIMNKIQRSSKYICFN
ncbi:MAG: ATP-dependent DNA helicase RecG [Clostridiaceae bacterium]|nr:ATP-dependent DNA helicase RecG [Clostridiaceae bacterium]